MRSGSVNSNAADRVIGSSVGVNQLADVLINLCLIYLPAPALTKDNNKDTVMFYKKIDI